ncbi:MAG: hypothetical protein J6S14_19710 [Clostridia bacterium]|nr:hypothetical protein [Clostridia bacterium]
MSVYDINGNIISTDSSLSESAEFEIVAANGDKAALAWEQGTLSYSGENYSATTRLRTVHTVRWDSLRYIFVHCPEGYKARAAIYSAETSTPTFVKFTDYATGNQIIEHENASYIYRFLFATDDFDTITPSDMPEDFYIVPVYLPLWDEKSNGMSVGPYTTARSNPEKVAEIVAVANTYWNNRNEYLNGNRVMVYGQTTILDQDTYTNNIDCSTFVGLCIRGIPFNDTPYHTGEDRSKDSYKANPAYDWSIDPFEFTLADEPGVRIRSVSRIAKWMYDQRRMVVIDKKLVNVEAGDIVCYSRLDSDGGYLNPHRFMAMTHTGLVISKRAVSIYDSTKTYAVGDCVQYSGALYECKTAVSTAEAWTASHWTKLYDTWDINSVPYCHIVMESTTTTPTIHTHVLERNWEDPTVVNVNNIHTLTAVCRPDLGSL